ncbi:hypothetical protein [robinz microvirus RP_82]|nr:hypothetical protein [robinz microvirus RP_82]
MTQLCNAIFLEASYRLYLDKFYSCPLRSKPSRRVFIKRMSKSNGMRLPN